MPREHDVYSRGDAASNLCAGLLPSRLPCLPSHCCCGGSRVLFQAVLSVYSVSVSNPAASALLDIDEVPELLAPGGVTELSKSLGLDLADPLSGDAEDLSHLLEGMGLSAV